MSTEDPITIGPATQEDIDWMNEHTGVETYSDGSVSTAGNVGEAAAVRFYGKLVAILNEYGTATVLEGIDKDKIERLGDAMNEVWPRRYREHGIRACYRCNYREDNHEHSAACDEFVPVPEHLRF